MAATTAATALAPPTASATVAAPSPRRRATLRKALAIRWPHRTYVLDDGSSAMMRAMAEQEGAGYIVRSGEWQGRQRHAKAGNLNNALLQTRGEFLLILDADQEPDPEILHRT